MPTKNTMAGGVQTNSASIIRWSIWSEAVSSDLWSYYCRLRRQYFSLRKVLRDGSQRHGTYIVYVAAAQIYILLGSASGSSLGQFPGVSHSNLYSSRFVQVHTAARRTFANILSKIYTMQGISTQCSWRSGYWSSNQGASYRPMCSETSTKDTKDSHWVVLQVGRIHQVGHRLLSSATRT